MESMERKIIEDNNEQRNRHLVLVPCPNQGHVNPMLQLGRALHSKGFSITLAHTIHNSSIGPHSHPDFTLFSLPDGLSDSDRAAGNYVANLLTINDNCKESLRRFLEQKDANGEAVSCVILDESMFAAEEAANSLKIPSVILRPGSAAATLAYGARVKPKKEGHSSHDLVPGRGPLRFKDLPTLPPGTDFQKVSLLSAKKSSNRNFQAIVWNTISCLEGSILEEIQQQCQVPIFAVGPLHMLAPQISSSLIEEDRSCISWLDKQPFNSVTYVCTTGSLASLGEEEVREIAWGLANSGQRFLWVIRPGSIRGSDWIELLPQGFQNAVGERGCIVKWAPQKDVLAHSAVGGFWSHCGWNSVLESLADGVPMICKPWFADQNVNARYVSHVWRVGLELEELERGEIERAIRRMILDDEGHEIRARAKEFKEKFEVSIKDGGCSYESLNELVSLIMSL